MKCTTCGRWGDHEHAPDLLAAKQAWDDAVEAYGWDSPMAARLEEDFQVLWSRDYGQDEQEAICEGMAVCDLCGSADPLHSHTPDEWGFIETEELPERARRMRHP